MKRYEVRCTVRPNRTNSFIIWADTPEEAQQKALKWWGITNYIAIKTVETIY